MEKPHMIYMEINKLLARANEAGAVETRNRFQEEFVMKQIQDDARHLIDDFNKTPSE